MPPKKGRPALVESAGHQNKLDLLFKTIDTENYNLVLAAGKAATPPLKPTMVDYRRIFGRDSWRGGERRLMEWQDSSGLPVKPPYRSFELGRVEAPQHMKIWVPSEDTELHRPLLSPLPAEVYALRRLLSAFDRASKRRIVRRNTAAPLDFGHRSEQANEAHWDFLLLIEEEDATLLRAVGYHPDSCFEEEVWQEALARAEGEA
ncbi:hypothetical protein [Rhizobium ruizarguesonis]|uniref:hypothetical protein n=1 Tax=Rhizobium ruizarguesonis TaxID=2081791 RepID=UPI0010314104|nr:hypothetical protein [Rhizobium ruizarguesonis]TAV05576.1 hypothetical protein ELI39_10020 [Rhizobium ruizarguesonis]